MVNPPLLTAIRAHSAGCVRALLGAGVDPMHTIDSAPWHFPLEVVFENYATNQAIADLILTRVGHFSPGDERVTDWVTSRAAAMGDTNLLKRLQDMGADLGQITAMGNAAFMAAAGRGHYDLAEKLLSESRRDFGRATNKVDVLKAIGNLTADPSGDVTFAKLLRHAQQIGIEFYESNQELPWTRAASYGLPFTAQALGCPPESVKQIIPRTRLLPILKLANRLEDLPLFTNLLWSSFPRADNRKAASTRLFAEMLMTQSGGLWLQVRGHRLPARQRR